MTIWFVDFHSYKMVSFHSYVSLPEGNMIVAHRSYRSYRFFFQWQLLLVLLLLVGGLEPWNFMTFQKQLDSWEFHNPTDFHIFFRGVGSSTTNQLYIPIWGFKWGIPKIPWVHGLEFQYQFMVQVFSWFGVPPWLRKAPNINYMITMWCPKDS